MTTVAPDHGSTSDAHRAALDYLYGRINYERQANVPYREENYRLDRMSELLERLGSPQLGQKIVHIAGTKGKGSTATQIAAILTASGRRTALFTSPHLERVEERMAVDAAPATSDELAELVGLVRPAVESMDAQAAQSGRMGPTYFEITTALALMHFARRRVDATVLEVGMGGRLDSTNVCTPLVSVVTNISLDHTEQLGHTLAAIAGEKAGIIKPHVPVVSGVTVDEARQVIRRVASERECRLVELDRDFAFTYHTTRGLTDESRPPCIDFRQFATNPAERAWSLDGVELGLLGRHQGANASLALATIGELRRRGWHISDDAIRLGLATARCPARVEVVGRRPTVIVDAAHNVAAIDALLMAIDESLPSGRRILVFATTRQKDIEGMLARLLPRFDRVFFTQYQNNPRAVPPEELAEVAVRHGCSAFEVYGNAFDAWQAARAIADPESLICVTGSFFIASELRAVAAGGANANRAVEL